MSTSDPARKPGKSSDRPAPAIKPLHLKTHRDMVTRRREVFQRVRANPELARLLVLNPVLAFEEMGVQVSPEMRHHILTSAQHPKRVRQRREELEKSLHEKTGQVPQPQDPKWVSKFLFKDLGVKPLNVKGLELACRAPANEGILTRLNRLRPPSRKRYVYEASIPAGTIMVTPWKPAVRHFDPDAPLPKMKTARAAPAEVSLEELYFYKDSHPLARDLLELAIIQRTGFNFRSRSEIRKITEGRKDNTLYQW